MNRIATTEKPERRSVIIHLEPIIHRSLRILAAENDRSLKRFIEEALAKLVAERIGNK